MTLTAIQAIKNKVENPDLILETNKKIVKDYLQDQVDELAKISVNEIKSFIENIATICNNEINELFRISDYEIFSNEKFKLTYYYTGFDLNFKINLPFPSEVEQAIIKCNLLDNGPYLERFGNFKFVVTDEDDTVIINTTFKTPYFYGFEDSYSYFSLTESVPE